MIYRTISIWQSHFLKELAKIFLLAISSFYILYILIDYSQHTKIFHSIPLLKVILYYIHQLAKIGEILFSVAFLISTIKVLVTLNLRNELVALLTSGISQKKLLLPFFYGALFISFLILLNFQFLQPLSLPYLEKFEEQFLHEIKQKEKKVHSVTLSDNSLLLYQSYDPQKKAFSDVYWIQNLDHIYRIQKLYPYEKIPRGESVDLMVRNSQKDLSRSVYFQELLFQQMPFEKKALLEVFLPSMQPLSKLARGFSWQKAFLGKKMSDRQAETCSQFFYKVFMAFVPFLILLGVAPYSMRFNRNLQVFLIYALSLFGIITFFTLAHSALILGESQVIPPFLGLVLTFGLFFLICGWRYARLKY